MLQQTAKRPTFQSAFVRIILMKIVLKQRKHKIDRVIMKIGIDHFLDPKSDGLFIFLRT